MARPRRYRYSERAAAYSLGGNRGRFVSRREIRTSVDAALANGAAAARRLTVQLREGAITLPEWQLAMARETKSAHLAALAAAHGGFDKLSPAAYGRAGAALRFSYQKLREFADGIASGAVKLDGRAELRAGSYIARARNLLEKEVGRLFAARGFDEARSVRRARDSCTAREGRSGCIEEARKGYQPLDAYTWPGDRTCLSACQCFTLLRNSATGAVAA